METEELTKLVDGIYKNILEKFNPGARQMINAGKAYLKALHGAAAASGLYVEAITKLAKQAQQGTWGGSSDIGAALMQVVEVYKEIQAQQMNILKAFYVDLLVPLETNLEKDTKVVQLEQKKFLQQHKARTETFTKAAANMKKRRKKGMKNGTKTGSAVDKELKNLQILEEEKSKLDVFCEQSLKSAMTQERRRYGFVLERQCSLAKHYLAYHNAGISSYGRRLDEWQEVAKTREYLPENLENMFALKLRQLTFWQDDNISQTILDDDRVSITSQLRKTKSMDASVLDVRSINDVSSLKPLSKAKSDFNLNSSTHSLEQEDNTSTRRPKSLAVSDKSGWGEASLARAMYAYLSSGDNQLSFLEGDIIVLLGDRKKGWQFGENLRTQCSGWFPLAYTEVITEDSNLSICSPPSSPSRRKIENLKTNPTDTQKTSNTNTTNPGKIPSTTMFGDTLLHRKLKKQNSQKTPIVTSLGPPPAVPAPIPELHQHIPQSITTSAVVHPSQLLLSPRNDASTLPAKRGNGYPPPVSSLPLHLGNNRANGAPGSLHSSNDSGFSNDPPPQPEVDYSDDESSRAQKSTLKPTSESHLDAKKKELFSSVRGWLLYKSALDLLDDVSDQNGLKHSIARTLSTRLTDNPGGTLGRFGSHDLLKPSPIAVGKSPEESNNKVSVKRTKSLWKFKRSNKNEILEGMALWKHRSLIDVRGIEKEENQGEKTGDEMTESIYASADSLLKERHFEKVHNEKNTMKDDKNETENYYKDDQDGLDDSSESIIVVNDHVNKKKNRCRYNVSNHSDITQSDTIVQKENKSEMSNSRSDLSEQTETETIGKESFLPRMKLIKSNSNDTWNHYIERDLSVSKDFQTWNPNLKNKEVKKWEGKKNNENVYKERANNKLKDVPKLFKDQLRLNDVTTTCGPWHDLWGVDSSVKS